MIPGGRDGAHHRSSLLRSYHLRHTLASLCCSGGDSNCACPGRLATSVSLAPGRLVGKIAFWMFTMTAMLIPVIGIGLFEGGYNHVLKDLLYFSGASDTLMTRLFPPPTYEMPGDAFFEITGI